MSSPFKSKPDAPAPVVVNAPQAAGEQATFNRDAALEQRALNMVDQYGPSGSLQYRDTGRDINGIPQMAAITSLSPEQQQLFNMENQAAQSYGEIGNTQLEAVRGTLETPFDVSGFGPAPTADEGFRQQQLDAMLARMNPQMETQRAAMETQLANQGFVPGTAAYDTAIDEQNRNRVDMQLAADAAAGNQMAQMYGLQTDERSRGINEALMQRNQPLTELSALASGSQPQMPNFIPTPQGSIGAPDTMGAQFANANIQNQAAQNAYNQDMGSYNSNLQGLYGLGGAGIRALGGGFRFGR